MKIDDIRPVWVEVNLNNLAHNIQEVRRLVGKDKLITAVVKANAYGHGIKMVAKTFLENSADRLAVATLSEALELRKEGFNEEILILGYTPITQVKLVIENNIIQTIYNYEAAKAFSDYAIKISKKIKIHIKIDTGMNRLGFKSNDEGIENICKIHKLPGVIIEGIYTHFAKADEKDKKTTHIQFNKFSKMIHKLNYRGIHIPIKHCCNSAATINFPEYHLDMVRTGIMLYGLYPSKEVFTSKVNLKPAMTLKAKISNINYTEAGEGISYGHIFTTKKRTKIGTLPIGYADGYSRILSNKAFVTFNGNKVPIVGRICMDQCMINLDGTDKAKIGDEVVLFGDGNKNTIHIDELAELLGTINYEVICMISRRVPRVFIKDNKIIHIKDYLAE